MLTRIHPARCTHTFWRNLPCCLCTTDWKL